jgi:hypothetical protein
MLFKNFEMCGVTRQFVDLAAAAAAVVLVIEISTARCCSSGRCWCCK